MNALLLLFDCLDFLAVEGLSIPFVLLFFYFRAVELFLRLEIDQEG